MKKYFLMSLILLGLTIAPCSPFLKVRKQTGLSIVKLVAKCGDESGEITFKNIPIEWDPQE